MKSLYEILKVSPLATSRAIEDAYKKLAYQYHPDRNTNQIESKLKFQAISEARYVLSDSQRRKEYDQKIQFYKENLHENTTTTPSQSEDGVFNLKEDEGYPDSLECYAKVRISLEQSHLGCEKLVKYHVNRNMKSETREVAIQIPRGVKNKQILHIEQSILGIRGAKDLFVKITVKKHPLFKVQKKDLILIVPVSVSDAILGTSLTIPTLTGQAKIDIPSLTHGGSGFILKNQGLSIMGGERGDLLVQIHIDIPDQITEKEKQWFKQFQKLSPLVAQFNILTSKILAKRAA